MTYKCEHMRRNSEETLQLKFWSLPQTRLLLLRLLHKSYGLLFLSYVELMKRGHCDNRIESKSFVLHRKHRSFGMTWVVSLARQTKMMEKQGEVDLNISRLNY